MVRHGVPGPLALIVLSMVMTTAALAGVTPQIEQTVRAATFEVVVPKPKRDPLSYEKPLPLELIPYQQRSDKYQPVGTAFALGPDTYVTAAHVLEAVVNSQYGKPALRAADGKVYPIDSIVRFSADEDFAVFTLAGAPKAVGLKVNRTPRLDQPVFAVGTALGEGIVIRDGLFTSETPEDQDGRWKWIRFSAAASPGNSGGPLLDALGSVIGVVIAKSPNENLNYALPIGIVLEAPHTALFDRRLVTRLPYMQGSRVYTMKDQFALPLRWTTFEYDYERVIQRHGADARAQLLAQYADSMFPLGSGSDAILYSSVQPAPDPGIILQQENNEWTFQQPSFDSTDLPGNGKVSVGEIAGTTLIRLERGNHAKDDGFYADSKQFMDVALKGLVIKRLVGTDAVRVASLGPAVSDSLWADRYGREWQRRVWPLPYLDSYVVAMLLPTPDGYVGLLQYSRSSNLTEVEIGLSLLANQVSLDYIGTLAQWQAFLGRHTLLPRALADVSLEAGPPWKLLTPRFQMVVPPGLVKLGPESRICLAMAYDSEASQLSWNVAGAWWYQDFEEKTFVALSRQVRPPASAREQLRNAYSDMQQRQSPYDGQPIRVSAGEIATITVLQADGSKPGMASGDVVYALSVGIGGDLSLLSLAKKQSLAEASVHILEHGVGGDVDRSASALDLRSQFETHLDQVAQTMQTSDLRIGSDLRGRTASEDFSDYIVKVYRNAMDGPAQSPASADGQMPAPAPDMAGLEMTLKSRAIALQSYWKLVPAMMHNRHLWADFLAHNNMPATTPHDASVLAAEAALRQELAGNDPNPRWGELAAALRDAYVAERDHVVGTIHLAASFDLHPRTTPCPPPAATTSGRDSPTLLSSTTALADYYPATMRRMGIEGLVRLMIRIDATGCVAAMAIDGSSGSDELDQAAMRWLETASFLPSDLHGHASTVNTTIPIKFNLQD